LVLARRNAPGSALLAKGIKINCMDFPLDKVRRPVRRRTENYGERTLFMYSVVKGSAEIECSLSKANRHGPFLNEKHLDFEKGSSIEGERLWGCSEDLPGKLVVAPDGGQSGRHSRQGVRIKKSFCYAIVINSWKGEALPPPHPKEMLSGNTGHSLI
jgi:hypothetical protein